MTLKTALSTVLLVAVALAAFPAQSQEVVAGPQGRSWDDRGVIIAFGMEGVWGTVHPHGYDLKDTLEVYDFDPYPGLFNLNVVAEVLFAVNPHVELGVHGAYNGLLDMDGAAGPASLTTQEIGGVARLLLGGSSRRAHGEVGFRFEGGVMLVDFEVDGISDNHTTGFVRPALTLGGGGGSDVGTELSFGWTFAQVDRGLGRAALPLGGLDLTLLIRIAP